MMSKFRSCSGECLRKVLVMQVPLMMLRVTVRCHWLSGMPAPITVTQGETTGVGHVGWNHWLSGMPVEPLAPRHVDLSFWHSGMLV